MKKCFKIISVFIFLCISSSMAFGQNNVNKNFIGYWSAEALPDYIIFFMDKDDVFQMVSWSAGDSYEEFEIIKIQIVGNTIKTTERFVSTNWVTYNEYSIIDENTLKEVVGGDGNGAIVYYKRLK